MEDIRMKPGLTLDQEIARKLALDFGARDAVVLEIDQVLLDPRVRFKCMIPKCYMSGACSHCPPHGFSLAQVRESINAHHWAVFFRVLVPPGIAAAKDLASFINRGVMDNKGALFNLGAHYLLVFSIVKRLQMRLRDMGYSSLAGFAAGNCKDALCHFHPLCQDLTTTLGCRHPGLSSPSMESCGMDVFAMAANAGWGVHPIGGACQPQSVPHASLMGLVLARSSDASALGGEAARLDPGSPAPQRGKGVQASLKSALRSLEAVRRGNAGAAQLPGLLQNHQTWSQFVRNLHEIEGSWEGVAARLLAMYTGRPRKKR